MKKKFLIPVILIALAVVAGVLLYMNRDYIKDSREGLSEGQVKVVSQGEELGIIDLNRLKVDLAMVTVEDQINASGSDAVSHVFGGVYLQDALDLVGIDYQAYTDITFRSLDGYASASNMEEMEADKLFLVYEIDGAATKSMEDGGSGPLEVVILGETFSQRNCKYLSEIELN